MMKFLRSLPGSSPHLVALLFLLCTATGPVWGVEIVGSLSNFDALQNGMPAADNFELEFYGPITAADFHGYYPGWGIAPRFDSIPSTVGLGGTEAMWLDRANPLLAGSWTHFGVSVNPALPPMQVKAWWTKVLKVRQIPVPFQWWYIQYGNVYDILTLSPTYTQPLQIRRDFAISPTPIPLAQLQYDSTPVTWSFFDVFTISPGDMNFSLTMPYMPDRSYLVRYTVSDPMNPGVPTTRFVTEAIPSLIPPAFQRVLVNFDLIQDVSGESFDNVELDFFGNWCQPSQVWDWYRNEIGGPGIIPAWGIDPLIRAFPVDFFPEMPGRSGFEMTWVDKFLLFNYGDRYHFGMTFDPAVMGPFPQNWTWVQGYWTNIVKTPVPVPWQFWSTGPGLNIRDIIQYAGEEVGPVLVNRQWVTLASALPLEDLTWLMVDPLPWNPVPGDPVLMNPGGIAELNVPVQTGDKAVLVRYTVEDGGGGGGASQTRVINEALVDATADVPDDGTEQHGLFLSPSRPNPASGTVEIRFGLPDAGPARLLIVDVTGRQIAVLHDGWMDAGDHVIAWDGKLADGTRAPSGVYFYALAAGQKTMTQRLVLEK
jgi:hypothetical protein